MKRLPIAIVVLFLNISCSFSEKIVTCIDDYGKVVSPKTHCPSNTQLDKKSGESSVSIANYLTRISNDYPGYVGMWPPTSTVTLGSIGSLGPDGFTQHTTISLQPQNSKESQLSMQEQAIIVKNPTADHALMVSFEGANGFVLQATELSSTKAADLTAVKRQVAKKLQSGDWDPSWYVVVGVQIAKVATVIVSQGNDAQLVLDGTVGAPLPLAGDAELSIASTKGSIVSFLATGYPVIMYRALKISDAWYFSPSKKGEDNTQTPKSSADGISNKQIVKGTIEGNSETTVHLKKPVKKLPVMEALHLKDVLSAINKKSPAGMNSI